MPPDDSLLPPDIGQPPPVAPPPLASPAAAPPNPSAVGAPPDIGTGAAPPAPGGMQPTISQAQPKKTGVPSPFGMPLLAQFMGQMFGGQESRGYQDMGPNEPARPVSRLNSFENFLGQFLNSFSQGMAQSGHGPGANIRGAGAAIQAPYQTALQQYGLQQQEQQRQAQTALTQSEAAQREAQTQQMQSMVTVPGPNGPVQMPLALAQKVLPAQIAGQARIAAAGTQKEFINTQYGVFDTRRQQYVGGPTAPGGPLKVTQDMINQYGLPQQMLDKLYKPTDLSSLMRGEAAMITPVKGAEDTYMVSKAPGGGKVATGVGNASENRLAWAKFGLQQAQFERDTFGQLFGGVAKQYPSLTSIVDPDGNVLGWKSPVSPTSSIKTQAQQAQDLHQLFADVRTELIKANAKGELGPYAGRMNELMTGKIGLDNEDFAKVRALGSLTASGLLKAHFGARGGQEMYQHFEGLFNTGKMTLGDLTGALDGFDTFMKTYAARVQTTKGGGPSAGGGGGPTVTYTEGQNSWNIPVNRVGDFTKAHPNAKRQ